MKVKISKSGNCIFLTQDLSDLDLYEKTKAIKNFVKVETQFLEEIADTEIRKIFNQNGIIIQNTDKSALQVAFDTLKSKGKEIVIADLYKNVKLANCVLVGVSEKNGIYVYLENDELLQSGLEIYEREI